jgi:hypothetical protein
MNNVKIITVVAFVALSVGCAKKSSKRAVDQGATPQPTAQEGTEVSPVPTTYTDGEYTPSEIQSGEPSALEPGDDQIDGLNSGDDAQRSQTQPTPSDATQKINPSGTGNANANNNAGTTQADELSFKLQDGRKVPITWNGAADQSEDPALSIK